MSTEGNHISGFRIKIFLYESLTKWLNYIALDKDVFKTRPSFFGHSPSEKEQYLTLASQMKILII